MFVVVTTCLAPHGKYWRSCTRMRVHDVLVNILRLFVKQEAWWLHTVLPPPPLTLSFHPFTSSLFSFLDLLSYSLPSSLFFLFLFPPRSSPPQISAALLCSEWLLLSPLGQCSVSAAGKDRGFHEWSALSFGCEETVWWSRGKGELCACVLKNFLPKCAAICKGQKEKWKTD